MSRLAIIIGCLFFLTLTVRGQETQDTVEDSTQTDTPIDTTTAIEPIDTVLFIPGSVFAHTASVTDSVNFEEHLIQHPTRAMLKSVVIPGWGQVGNKRYTKAIFFAGLQVWFIGSALDYRGQASDLEEQFHSTPDSLTSLRSQIWSEVLNRRNSRNKYTWFAVIGTLAGMMDAYVDAHLSGYPRIQVTEQSSLELHPQFVGEVVRAELTLRF